ncbi:MULTISPECIES: YihY/virulence factor BrkB family protein [Streptomyces]|uniref:YihY/virulence factor BrkB family protein n=1 Tax=Streptomyces cyaneofuscatus TaxID=66883 RepID=A0ABZ1F669_9ACTN|nr:YhjD/YihY/BrkB family envelope integrity protein [Streptomyces cyaneofuscatus]WSB11730.1 YihY/virulence factor BrkB family protein [Streptomyces cyaneofuscatus]WSD44737.1 YihY/virulence factor BrkB family protein [Streptomyces cyaneofuscatus]WTA87933.1 YihY/virulence factor BrkB family protein [Streptomyces cyaneofuscatus]
MGTATRVPVTHDMTGDELSADEALVALRRYGRWPLLRDAFVRFRYADGFSHSRALALQTILAIVPLVIAFVGLSTALHTENVGRLAELTIRSMSEGPSASVVDEALNRNRSGDGDGAEIALWFGLLFSVVNVTTAMCQIERGANRIYGVERDRVFHRKYLRGLVMSLSAGIPLGIASIMIVAGGDFVRAATTVYGLGEGAQTAWNLLRVPLGLLLALISASAIFRRSPRRRQPGYTWLAFGAAVYLVLWTLLTWLLSLYLQLSGSFDTVYGPLSLFMALLLWSYLTSLSLFLGLSFAAQLEAVRAGKPGPITADPGT